MSRYLDEGTILQFPFKFFVYGEFLKKLMYNYIYVFIELVYIHHNTDRVDERLVTSFSNILEKVDERITNIYLYIMQQHNHYVTDVTSPSAEGALPPPPYYGAPPAYFPPQQQTFPLQQQTFAPVPPNPIPYIEILKPVSLGITTFCFMEPSAFICLKLLLLSLPTFYS